jgi:hypothetical protein
VYRCVGTASVHSADHETASERQTREATDMSTERKRGGAAAAARVIGAVLCLAVVVIHVIDQQGIPGSKSPVYVGVGYWVLEVVGLITAIALAVRATSPAWFVAIGVGSGPLLGYVLSRGPGLPDYTDDVGNWLEPLGVVSLAVEVTLVVLAAVTFIRDFRARTTVFTAVRYRS